MRAETSAYLPGLWEGLRPRVKRVDRTVSSSHVVVLVEVEMSTKSVQLVSVSRVSPDVELVVAITKLNGKDGII